MQDQPIPLGFCQCGCGQRTKIAHKTSTRWGWVKGQPHRLLQGHGGRIATPYQIEEHGFETPCWIWQLSRRGSGGYGQAKRAGRPLFAHRLYYEQAKGAIPDGWHVHHRCGIRLCVNPDHLEAIEGGTHMRRHRSARRYERFAVIQARQTTSLTQVEIADMLGVTRGVVHRAGDLLRSVDSRSSST